MHVNENYVVIVVTGSRSRDESHGDFFPKAWTEEQ